ncbi:MAG: alginate export family protein [Candidatus Omnitrophota bacterium]
MSRRLILVLALAVMVGFAFAAYAEVQNVKVSGDLTVYGLARQLSLTSQRAENTMASIARVRIDADLTDNVMATVRLINERYWGKDTADTLGNDETASQGVTGSGLDNTNIDLDLAYVTMKEFLYSPLTLTIGRQELHFGNDMIIGDAYTNNHASKASPFSGTIDPDLSMRKSFDAVRATLNYSPLVIDIVAAQIRKAPKDVFSKDGVYSGNLGLNTDDQETLVGFNANYALSKKTTVEAYAWQKRVGKKELVSATSEEGDGKKQDTNVIGARVAGMPINDLSYSLEGAYQFGRVETADVDHPQRTLRAFAAEAALTYNMKDMKNVGKYKPTATALYAYFSGDVGGAELAGSGNKRHVRAWDPMYENQTFGNIANDLINQTNAHILGGIVTMKPVDDITLKGEYYAFWWDKRIPSGLSVVNNATGESDVMTGKKFAAQEVDLTATYDYTEDVQFSLLGGLLFPGKSFQTTNRNTAGELIGSMKVTF